MTQPKTYIRDERDESDVSAIVVVETGDEGVRVTENREDVHWSKPFWMPEQVGLLPDEKSEDTA